MNDASLSSSTRSFSGSGSGSVLNQGSITAANGGYVALLGNNVSNQGVIVAQLGTVALGAGSAATLTFSDTSLVHMQVDQSVLNSMAQNGGLIKADGGLVVMAAGSKDTLLASVVNNTGVIEAHTVEDNVGTISLLAGMAAGTVNVGGTLDASALVTGNGGAIETSAAHVKVVDGTTITTAAAKGATGSWLIDPLDFTIAATGGDISGTTLASELGSTGVTIASANGGSTGTGNVNVNDTVTWSANKLTLNAQNNININSSLNGSGTASLALQYGQGALALANTSAYNVNAAVNLEAGNNFSTKLGSDGATKQFTVITSLGAAGSMSTTDLQGMNGNLATNYALGSNIDATGTSQWNGGAGFTPVGNTSGNYSGTFDGLGHTISALTINRPGVDGVGLIGYAAASAVVQNVGMLGGSVTGGPDTGMLIGAIPVGMVNNSYASGSSVVGSGSVTGTLNGDTLVISAGVLDNKNAGGGKAVTLVSSDPNYSVSQVGLSDSISTKLINLSGLAATPRAYDGSNTVVVTASNYSAWVSKW